MFAKLLAAQWNPPRRWMELMNNARRVINAKHERKRKDYEKCDGVDYHLIDNEAWRYYIKAVTEAHERWQTGVECAGACQA